MKQLLLSLFLVTQLMTCQQNVAKQNPNSLQIQFTNGLWFNGNTFVERTVWVKNGILSFTGTYIQNDTIINLAGKYVIPPFAEAHNHNLESAYGLEKRINAYLDNGVFYVKHLSSIKKRIGPLMHQYNNPNGLEVSLAHAPFTGTGGHPIALRKRYLDAGYFDGLFNSLEEVESHGYYIMDNEDDLNRKWEQVLSFQPDFIKINLLYSEEYQKRKNDTTYFGRKGLDPNLVPAIVSKAHQHKLRVSAHVETTHDFHIAVTAGVDEIAHLPEIRHGKAISVADAKIAAQKGIVVVTTTSLITKNKKWPNYQELVDNIGANLKLLKDAGVTIALGSDMYNDNSVGEFKLLHSLEVFSNLELLKMWCENSAVTTLPHRKVGYLKEGFEASFLVLDKNPLEDMLDINKSIQLKIKQGTILE
ncbi:amidohydrolase family protein [uncultured Allomuricauda sp.]|uniref:amidohydrolase family protein n=1 Tax=Flagellimonas sp. W118 TaxID=3410791 RepID=UPI00260C738E|nr:amidohydrolase family protein [uncultured Allomuricauda sp.]